MSASVVHYSMNLYQIQAFGSTSVIKCMSLKCYFARENITRMCLCMTLIVVQRERERAWINKYLPHFELLYYQDSYPGEVYCRRNKIFYKSSVGWTTAGKRKCAMAVSVVLGSVEGAVLNTVSWEGTIWQRQRTGLARATASNVEKHLWSTCDLRDLACDGRVTLRAKQATKRV